MKDYYYFEPWEGYANKRFRNLNKKVLVIGASRYCQFVVTDKQKCHYLDECQNAGANVLKLKRLEKNCPLIRRALKKVPV